MAKHLASLFGTEQDRVNVRGWQGDRDGERGRTLSSAWAQRKKKRFPAPLDLPFHRRPPLRPTHTHAHPTPPPSPLPLHQCPFYFKIGACRHGDRCSRQHNKPTISPTLLLPHLYVNPALPAGGAEGGSGDGSGAPPAPAMDPAAAQAHFEAFYEDLAAELTRYGRLDGLHVCDNLSDHLVGSVYAAFADEDAAARALTDLSTRFYDGRPIRPEFSPVTDPMKP